MSTPVGFVVSVGMNTLCMIQKGKTAMSKQPTYICPAEYVFVGCGKPIAEVIREERSRLDDVEWETGQRPNEDYLNYLLGEQARGIREHKTQTKLVRNPGYDKWMTQYG